VTRSDGKIHLDVFVDAWIVDEMMAMLSAISTELHHEAARMSEDDGELRRQADQAEAAKKRLWLARHSTVVPLGPMTDQRGASGCATNNNHVTAPINNNVAEPWLIAVSCTALVMAVVAMGGLWWVSKEFKQVQIQLMYSNALMLREGLVKPGDEVYGPEGNLLYRQHELKPKDQ